VLLVKLAVRGVSPVTLRLVEYVQQLSAGVPVSPAWVRVLLREPEGCNGQ
jgi:hypothetical protein